MLIAHGLVPDLVSQLSSYSLFGIAPIWWDQTEGQFKVKKSAFTCIGTVITFQLGMCLIIYDLYRQYQLSQISQETTANSGDSSGTNLSSIEKAFNRVQRISCALLLFTVAIFHGRNMRCADAIVAFFNGMIAFEQKYTGRIRLATDWKGKLTKYLCFLVRLTNNGGPLLISILVAVSEHSSPLNLVAFLTPYSSSLNDLADNSASTDLTDLTSYGITMNNQMVQRFITGTITMLLNMIIWYVVVNIRGFWTCGQILIGCYGIRSALNLYASILTRGKLLKITNEKTQEALIYREIQLLTSLFNEIHGNSIFVILLLSQSLLQTVSLYLYAHFIATMTIPFVLSSWTSRLFVAYMIFDGIFCVYVVFGCSAGVYITSLQVKEQLQSNEVFEKNEWFTQFFLSCSTIKLKCGSTNFISEGQFGNGMENLATSSLDGTDNASTVSANKIGMNGGKIANASRCYGLKTRISYKNYLAQLALKKPRKTGMLDIL